MSRRGGDTQTGASVTWREGQWHELSLSESWRIGWVRWCHRWRQKLRSSQSILRTFCTSCSLNILPFSFLKKYYTPFHIKRNAQVLSINPVNSSCIFLYNHCPRQNKISQLPSKFSLLPSPSPSFCFPPSLTPSHAYLKLLSSGQLPASASEVTCTSHCSQPFLGSWFVVHRRSRKRNVACFSLGLFLFMSWLGGWHAFVFGQRTNSCNLIWEEVE